MSCAKCGDQGLIRVAYRSGEPFDVAICACPRGSTFRRFGPSFVAGWLGLDLASEHRIAPLEDFSDDVMPRVETAADSFIAAAKVAKRAKL